MTQIAILHPGEMGAAIGGALVDLGHDVCWRPDGRGAATRRRAADAGLRECDDVLGCDLVISICPPAAAIDVARSVGDFTGIYLDANAISPDTARDVAAIVSGHGADYVDGGVVGGPPTTAGTARLYLSGRRCADVAAIFAGARIEPRIVGPTEYAASAVKMTYAAWTKISAALLLAAHDTAVALEVGDALDREWAQSQGASPALAQRLESARRSAATKGWRWEDEMREIARTFAGAGQPDGFGSAAADVFSRHPRPVEDSAG